MDELVGWLVGGLIRVVRWLVGLVWLIHLFVGWPVGLIDQLPACLLDVMRAGWRGIFM